MLVTINPLAANAGLTTDNTVDRSANLSYCASDFSSIVPTSCINLHKAAVISFVKTTLNICLSIAMVYPYDNHGCL